MDARRFSVPLKRDVASLLTAAALAGNAFAGGTPENALLIVDPTNPDSLYIGNYYKSARNIPDSNVLYIQPGAANYTAFVDVKSASVLGSIQTNRSDALIDYVVIAAPPNFYVSAPGLISDSCFSVSRFSISGAYTISFITADVLGGMSSQTTNRFWSTTTDGRAFDGATYWNGGNPATPGTGKRYLLGACLGYTGPLGNTLDDITDMIDRSVAVDGTRPAGTFYFEQTTDSNRSGPRHNTFPAVVAAINTAGGVAEHQMAVLPLGETDCLGIMTGWASPGIDAANIGILPGAFCDHLTSYAATFDNTSQEKISRWIFRGASGSWGTVQEPCNYPGKFPHARVHLYYFQGCSLGEAVFRGVQFIPFQGLLYGDPLTRPFAYLPTVTVADAPTKPVSGTIPLTPSASTAHPNAAIASLDLLVDGLLKGSAAPGQPFSLDTTELSDGWHDVRVLAYDDTLVRSAGRWAGSIVVNHDNRAATVSPSATSGDLATAFVFDLTASPTDLIELRLIQGTRVLAAAPGPAATFTVHGQTLGGGVTSVFAEALYPNRVAVRSAPLALTIANSGTPAGGQAPVAYNFRKRLRVGAAASIELPANFSGDRSVLTYTVVSPPASATLPAGQSGPARLVRPPVGFVATDSFTYQVGSPFGSSAIATVTLEYGPCLGDIDEDFSVGLSDLAMLLSQFGNSVAYPYQYGDLDGDRFITLGDLALLLSAFGSTCAP